MVFENESSYWDFPSGPGTKTLHSQCRGTGFDPWSGNWIPYATTKDPTCCNQDQVQPNESIKYF